MPKHPALEVPTIALTPSEAEAFAMLCRIAQAMGEAVKHQAKHRPSPSGLYPVTLLMDADGNVHGADGVPVVTFPPLVVTGLTADGAVVYEDAKQHVSPKDAAKLAGVHQATIWRAVKEGVLPQPIKLSSRRVGFPLPVVRSWLAGRAAEAEQQARMRRERITGAA